MSEFPACLCFFNSYLTVKILFSMWPRMVVLCTIMKTWPFILCCLADEKYGTGVYFTKNPKNLVETQEKCDMDHLICLFEAEVVTGSYTRGNRSFVAPPLINASSMKLYDSVVDDIYNPEIFVIFNREQALPLYLLTCSLLWNPPQKTNLETSAQNLSSPWGSPECKQEIWCLRMREHISILQFFITVIKSCLIGILKDPYC